MESMRSNVPASSATTRSSPGNDSVSDLFSTLFSSNTTTLEHDKIKSRLIQDTSESDSEFGAFVSVPAAEDPLSLDFGLPEQKGSPSMNRISAANNPSLTFFDKFAQDAKAASDRNKQGVLDELLKYEDDPLYWLKNDHKNHAASQSVTHTPDLFEFHGDNVHTLSKNGETVIGPQQSRSRPQPDIETDHANTKVPVDDLLDLDHDFFTSKTPVQQPRPHMATHPGHSPSRSSTLSLPIVPAPPVADTHNAEIFTASPANDYDPFSHFTPPKARRSSHSTLSNLSSRFMSSFLNSSKSHPHHSHPSLESIFAADSSQHRRSQSSERSPPSATKLYRTASHPVSDVQISHGTPFGRSVNTSPFASHTYIPPSGAPGYRGEQYDWDKGFSDDLDRELIREEAKEQKLVGLKSSASAPDVAHLIEKKTGNVDLNGRKASTTPVLDVHLADLIRLHLSALARLPRKWTLIYSLDQHGISLNTLYDRCEAHMQVKPGISAPAGALLVIKDDGDALFGVWMGKEGVHPSRGKGYYGSGESFLWKYIGGKLQVFKWTGKNDYVALCEPEYISFGGGDGNYGLYLDESLFEGSSAACPTFANEPLCSAGTKNAGVVAFQCVGLEVWAIGP